ncbi:MAG: hypothetical protein M3315_16310 [Actinomycetota bacterium]|nr:hypothetical protein [Actinomycetota bacterium]
MVARRIAGYARQETPRYTDAHIRRRRSRRLGLGAVLLILFALGAALFDYYTAANFEFTSVRNLLAEKYGVSADGIQARAEVQQPEATPQPGVPGDVSSLADCLT